jgi:NAD(P)-dependent dehydrogenase (short-subunit alcohol dehydrogenase family)
LLPPGLRAAYLRRVQRALIQGGSRGLGLALTEVLLARDPLMEVIVTSRNPQNSLGLQALMDQHSRALRCLALDVTDEVQIQNCAETLGSNIELDLLVNVSGVLHGENMQPERRLEEVKPETMLESFRVHTLGPLLMAKHFLPHLTHGRRAVFASLSARVGSITDNRLGGWYSYRSTKAAQNMVTKNLSIECKRRAKNLICVALHPGTVNTDLSRPFAGKVPEGHLFSPSQAAKHLVEVIDGLSPEDTGGFFAWDGQPIPW